MFDRVITHYTNLTNNALKSLKNEQQFNFTSNKKLLEEMYNYLVDQYKRAYESAGGEYFGLNDYVESVIDEFMNSMKQMNKETEYTYNIHLLMLKSYKDINLKQQYLNQIADKGITGYRGKVDWNIETYSNMRFNHISNEMVRVGILDKLLLTATSVGMLFKRDPLEKLKQISIAGKTEAEKDKIRKKFIKRQKIPEYIIEQEKKRVEKDFKKGVETGKLMVQISTHNTICDICKPYEGKTMTLEELEYAKAGGFFHPNCKHYILNRFKVR
jgi:hypothetical protein